MLELKCDLIRELIETEDGKCKWGLLTLHNLLMTLRELSDNDDQTVENGSMMMMATIKDEINDCLDNLEGLDTDRRARYEIMRRPRELSGQN